MSQENESAQEEVVEQEEQTSGEEIKETESQTETVDDNSISLKKEDYKKLMYKVKAYDANKEAKKNQPRNEIINNHQQETVNPQSVIQVVTALKGLNDDEITTLESEAQTLGVDLIKYIKSESGKTMLKNVREEKKSKDASSELTSKSPVYKKFSQEDLGKMSSAELEKILPRI